MNIITKDQLAETVFRIVLNEMKDYYDSDTEGHDTLDDYVYNNLSILGDIVYNYIGESYGDCDDAVTELGVE